MDRSGKFIAAVVAVTVILSLVAHGISANPLASLIGKKESNKTKLT